MNEILKTERLTKTYGKSIAVNEVSLTVRQGDIYGLIGKMAPERLHLCVWYWGWLHRIAARWSFSAKRIWNSRENI